MALVVFTGGARSGKSMAASRLAAQRELDGGRVCVAVFGRERESDPEFGMRIERHRADRPAAWTTLEVAASDRWIERVPDDAVLVTDCLGTLLGLIMEERWPAAPSADDGAGLLVAAADVLPNGYESTVRQHFDSAVGALIAREGDTIVVTNEVGDGIVPAYATGRLFRDLLGRANRAFVSAADSAYLCVAGRLIDLGSLARDARWPED